MSTILVMMAHASVASSKPKVELDSLAGTYVVGDKCLFMTIVDQLMSTVTIQKMAKEEQRQLMLQ